jgi:WD40 repeat protein
VRCLCFFPDGKTLASGSFDSTACLWDVRTAKELRRLSTGNCKVNAIAVSADGRLLATAENPQSHPIDLSERPRWEEHEGGHIQIRDARTGAKKTTLRGPKGLVLSIAFSPDGKTLVSGGGMWRGFSEVVVWDLVAGKPRQHLHGHHHWVEHVAFSPDGRTLASAGGVLGGQGELKLWDLPPLASPASAPQELRLREQGYVRPGPTPPRSDRP